MPHTKSAVRRMKQSLRRREANRSARSSIASTRRAFFEAAAKGDKSKSQELFLSYSSILDKAAKKGVIGANTADRRKSRAALKMKAL